MKNSVIVTLFAVLAAIAGAMSFYWLNHKPLPEYALYYQQPRSIAKFELTDQNGNKFTNENLYQHWSLVFIGYTSCPDVCPTSLQHLAFAYSKIKNIAANSQVLFLTADPKRDTQSKLKQYIQYFNPEFIALRANHDVLFPLTRDLGLMYAITEQTSDENYLVDHSASIALINPQGQLAAIFKAEIQAGQVPGVDMNKLLTDFAKIVALHSK